MRSGRVESSVLRRAYACLLIHAALFSTVPATAFAQTQSQSCVDVRVGDAQSYACLNEQLARLVPGHRPSSADTTINAWLPAPAAGTYNQAALREHLGNTYGYSVVPQRDPPAVYPLPFATNSGRRP